MAKYGKQFFDRCLIGVVGELESLEEEHPDWPDDLAQAATLVLEKADRLLAASSDPHYNSAESRNQILKEAMQTGAMALRFLLNITDELRYEVEQVRW